MKKFISLTLLSILVFTFTLFLNTDDEIKDVQAITPTIKVYAENSQIELLNKNVKKINEQMEIDLHEPNIKGFSNQNFEEKVNEDINNYINNLKDQFENTLEKDTLFAKEKKYSLPKYEMKSNYTITYSDKNLLSFIITTNSFTGGDYSTINKKSYNIDLKEEKIVNLQDLFVEGEDFQQVINNKISEDIAKVKNSYYANKFSGIDYDQQFYMEKDNIVIHFPMNEIAPYTLGAPEFKISFNNFHKGIDLNSIPNNDLPRIITDRIIRHNNEVNTTIKLPKIQLENNRLNSKVNEYMENHIYSFIKSIENESKNKKNMSNGNSIFIPYNVNVDYKVFNNSKDKILIGISKTHFDGNTSKTTDSIITIDIKNGKVTSK